MKIGMGEFFVHVQMSSHAIYRIPPYCGAYNYIVLYTYVVSLLSPIRHTDVMAIIITIIFLYFAFQPKCLRQVGADAYPLIPGWDFRGDHRTFFGLK